MKDQRIKRTLRELRDLLNDERNLTIVAIIDRDDQIGRLVGAAVRAEPKNVTAYADMTAYTSALTAYEPILARAWGRYDSLLWTYVGEQLVALQSVFAPIATHQNAAVRARFHKGFGTAFDRAIGKMEYLGKASPASDDPVVIRGKIPAAWQILKEELRPLWEQLDRQGGLKPSEALKDKPSLVGHLEKLDALGSVEAIARMNLDTLTKRLDGNAEAAELVYIALLPKAKRDEYERAKHFSAPAEPPSAQPEYVAASVFKMPLTIEEIVAAGNPFVFPSPNGNEAYVWKHGAEAEKIGTRVSDYASKSAAQLKKMDVPGPAIVLIQATWTKPVDARKLARALADKERVEKEVAPRSKRKD